MEIILLRRVEKLGEMGEVVRVKDGYARNFLLPQNFALRATAENCKQFEHQRKSLETTNTEQRQEAEKVSSNINDNSYTLIRQASESGQLYGSVTAADVAECINAEGTELVRSQVKLGKPIKTLGIHPVRIFLHPEVSVVIQVVAARSEEEAKTWIKNSVEGTADAAKTSQISEDSTIAVEVLDEFFEEGAGPASLDADDSEPDGIVKPDSDSDLEPEPETEE